MRKNFPTECVKRFCSKCVKKCTNLFCDINIIIISRPSGNFPDHPKNFQTIWKVSRPSRNSLDHPETFHNLRWLKQIVGLLLLTHLREYFKASWYKMIQIVQLLKLWEQILGNILMQAGDETKIQIVQSLKLWENFLREYFDPSWWWNTFWWQVQSQLLLSFLDQNVNFNRKQIGFNFSWFFFTDTYILQRCHTSAQFCTFGWWLLQLVSINTQSFRLI